MVLNATFNNKDLVENNTLAIKDQLPYWFISFIYLIKISYFLFFSYLKKKILESI